MLTLLTQAESTRAQGTAPAEDASSWPSKGLEPASSFHLPTLTPRQPSVVPESFPLQTRQLQLRENTPGKDSTITKEHTLIPESAASVFSRSNGKPETLNILDLDAKNMEEAPAEIEPPSAAQDSGVKPEESTIGPILRLGQHNSGAGSLGSAVTKGEDAHPEEPVVKPQLRLDHIREDAHPEEPAVKPPLRLDHIREVSPASATSASNPRVPADDAPSYLLDNNVSETKLTKAQHKRLRDKARKQAQTEQRKIVRRSSREISNSE